jgi:tRNA (mo5U34)-methyltransferase
MGVLYHRRSPLEHLWQLKDQLVSGGELVLETLVIEGDEMPFWCLATATPRCATCTLFLPRWR